MANTDNVTEEGPADVTIGVRLPVHLREAIEKKRAAMATATPGASITTSDALRALLLVGIAAERT